MLEYIKDWRIWLLSLVILLIVGFTDWAWSEEIKYEQPEIQDSIQWRVDDFSFKWKINKVEAKYELFEDAGLALKVKGEPDMKAQALISFTITW